MIDDQKNDIKLIRKSTSSKKGEKNKSLEDLSQESHLYFFINIRRVNVNKSLNVLSNIHSNDLSNLNKPDKDIKFNIPNIDKPLEDIHIDSYA